jgi:cysteinyl-tRNA synthetase
LDLLYGEALAAMANDLNTSVALAKALEGAKAIVREGETMNAATGESALRFLNQINGLLGIVRNVYDDVIAAFPTGPVVDEARIVALIEERATAKKAKNFARSDEIRDQLAAEGIELRDTPGGTEWSVK